jgi:hypothetical protein
VFRDEMLGKPVYTEVRQVRESSRLGRTTTSSFWLTGWADQHKIRADDRIALIPACSSLSVTVFTALLRVRGRLLAPNNSDERLRRQLPVRNESSRQ